MNECLRRSVTSPFRFLIHSYWYSYCYGFISTDILILQRYVDIDMSLFWTRTLKCQFPMFPIMHSKYKRHLVTIACGKLIDAVVGSI